MTVNVQFPLTQQVGTGTLTTFNYNFQSIETEDIQVWLDGVLQVEYSHYTYENTGAVGGDIEFITAPELGAIVTILRRTPVTQQTDYVDGTPFPAETHEGGADKLILILQEMIDGAYDPSEINGVVDYDLSVTQQAATVTVVNEAGTDAVIPTWEDATYAGAMHGEITTSAPTDGDATAKPDGYVWLEVAP